MVTEKPRAWSRLARDEATIPFPKEEVTPPVTKIYLVLEAMNDWVPAKLGF